MIKKIINKDFLVSSFICLIVFIEGIIAYPFLPDTVATHFNLAGVPNGYSSKEFVTFFIPLFLFCANFLVHLSFVYSEKKQTASKLYSLFYKSIIPVVALFVQNGIILYALKNININVILGIIILLLVIIAVFISAKERRK